VAASAAPNITRVHLELGGKAPVVVFDDADVEAAVEGIAVAGFFNAGQDCTAASRVLVAEPIHDEFVAALVAKARHPAVGGDAARRVRPVRLRQGPVGLWTGGLHPGQARDELAGLNDSEVVEAVFGPTVGIIKQYVDILATDGVVKGLIGPRETDRLWDRHVLNSVAISGLTRKNAEVVDVGSGAGLPGIPLAVLRPDLRVTLLEPLLRRVTFLSETVTALGLDGRVRVVRGRAEEHSEHYDVVASRALAPLGRLVRWCAPLRRADGLILALKGRSAADEIADADQVLAATGLAVELMSISAHPALEPATVLRLGPRATP
jgi:16S rRNA (guanine527-N7)-methyltransferase